MANNHYNFTTPNLRLSLEEDSGTLRVSGLSDKSGEWISAEAQSSLVGVTVNGSYIDSSSLKFIGLADETTENGIRQVIITFHGAGVEIRQKMLLYPESDVLEFIPEIKNSSNETLRIERIDSLVLPLVADHCELFFYTGNWGSEFEPHFGDLRGEVVLESKSGRSTKGNHPWFALTNAKGQVLSASIAWSGNWKFRFEPLAGGGSLLSGGITDWNFAKDQKPGEVVSGAPVVLVVGKDLNAVSQQYARVGRKFWYPSNEFTDQLPVEWNHWWPYEDAEINEQVFAKNVEVAARMGFDICTLDAGWFGPADAGTFWEHYRGDWDLVNKDRFPGGIRKLADHVHANHMKFGIWCEIEGLGTHAQVAKDHPDYPMLRDGEWIGGVCFGNPRVQEWAYQTLSRLINEYGADWIKVDFNLDPGAGCNRTDHGHQADDGLYQHYQGYYGMLERIRREHPDVVLENCSSGGLRIDLGMMRQTHMTFLSDPDWPVHDLQIFWGASTMLAPNVLLHWPFSDWRNLNPPPYQTFDPHDPTLTQKKWDYYSRISMLGLFGYSQKLPDLPEWIAKRMEENISVYKKHVRKFVKEADLYRLTEQPRRSGEGERWTAFQYSLPDKTEHLLFVFRLPGAEPTRVIRLVDLEAERLYAIEGLEGEFNRQMPGQQLMEAGIEFSDLEEEDSLLLRLL